MSHLSHYDTAVTSRPDSMSPQLDGGGHHAFRIKKMIDDMRRVISSLDTEITLEEDRTRVHDQSHYTYPITAKSMRQRRDNLMLTIAALEAKLPGAERIVATSDTSETVSAA